MSEEDDGRRERRGRYLIYIVLFLLVVAGLVLPFGLDVPVSPEARDCYELIENLPERPRVFLVADYSAAGGDRNEGDRQVRVLAAHVLRRGGRLIAASTSPAGAQSVDTAVRQALAEHRLTYGEHAINLGARPATRDYVISAAADFARAAQGHDHRGEDLALMPLTYAFRRLNDGYLLIWVGDGSGLPLENAAALGSQYGVLSVVAGSGTAGQRAQDLASDGRIDAVLPGVRATADYEALYAGRGTAAKQLRALTLGTLFILAIIIWAYISGWLGRRPREAGGGI